MIGARRRALLRFSTCSGAQKDCECVCVCDLKSSNCELQNLVYVYSTKYRAKGLKRRPAVLP